MERPHPDPQKLLITQQYEKQLKEFIEKGGQITQVPYGHSVETKKAGPV